jgi:hypothetical protein
VVTSPRVQTIIPLWVSCLSLIAEACRILISWCFHRILPLLRLHVVYPRVFLHVHRVLCMSSPYYLNRLSVYAWFPSHKPYRLSYTGLIGQFPWTPRICFVFVLVLAVHIRLLASLSTYHVHGDYLGTNVDDILVFHLWCTGLPFTFWVVEVLWRKSSTETLRDPVYSCLAAPWWVVVVLLTLLFSGDVVIQHLAASGACIVNGLIIHANNPGGAVMYLSLWVLKSMIQNCGHIAYSFFSAHIGCVSFTATRHYWVMPSSWVILFSCPLLPVNLTSNLNEGPSVLYCLAESLGSGFTDPSIYWEY